MRLERTACSFLTHHAAFSCLCTLHRISARSNLLVLCVLRLTFCRCWQAVNAMQLKDLGVLSTVYECAGTIQSRASAALPRPASSTRWISSGAYSCPSPCMLNTEAASPEQECAAAFAVTR